MADNQSPRSQALRFIGLAHPLKGSNFPCLIPYGLQVDDLGYLVPRLAVAILPLINPYDPGEPSPQSVYGGQEGRRASSDARKNQVNVPFGPLLRGQSYLVQSLLCLICQGPVGVKVDRQFDELLDVNLTFQLLAL